jgi:Mrp family chromosome partitioning ATPase
MRRIFSPANVIAVLVAIAVFYVGLLINDANAAILGWAIIAAGAGAVAWFVVDRRTSGTSLAGVLASIPFLGAIPVDASGPAPVLSNGELADRYTGLLREIEGQTTGRVLLVSSPSPGQGASSVAVNLSIAATKAGRRVMLVDADPSPNGIGRFLSSGASPGLSDVASGSATLAEASRMWTLDDGTRFPMLPSGSSLAAGGDLSGVLVADALDVVSEHADLIIIDVPPVMWSDATPELGAHADGTILVLTDSANPDTVAEAIHQLGSIGAPVLGYVRNRSKGTSALAPHAISRFAKRFVALALILVFGYTAYTGAQLFSSWNRRETQVLNTGAVADLGASAQAAEPADPQDVIDLPEGEGSPVPSSPSVTAPTEAYETLLIIGNDEIGGAADVVLYLVRPTNGADPFMVSLPRDLYVENPCTKGNSRINTLIKG